MDYYSVLGVSKTATPDEIKKAYRKLASQHHPDKGGDKAKFQEIQSAYDVLGDPEKRRQYDMPQPRVNMNNMNMNGFNMNINGMDINDIFSQIFNNGGRGPFNVNVNQKQLLRTQLQVSLQNAYTGTAQTVRLNFGQGVTVINITVPPGIKTGDQIKYENIIENATLIVEFIVLPDLKFDRKGNDLYCNHSISVLDLIVGSDFNFTTISGKVLQVSVPPKTQPFMQIKLAGQGMPVPNTPYYGDQLILLKPYIPDNIDDDIVNSILRSRAK